MWLLAAFGNPFVAAPGVWGTTIGNLLKGTLQQDLTGEKISSVNRYSYREYRDEQLSFLFILQNTSAIIA
jgi:hypothetical protein